MKFWFQKLYYEIIWINHVNSLFQIISYFNGIFFKEIKRKENERLWKIFEIKKNIIELLGWSLVEIP